MNYVEIISAFWLFIKEIINDKKQTKTKASMNFILSAVLIVSLVFNLFLFIRVFSITRHFMELHAVDSRTIKILTQPRVTPPVKLPDATNTNLPVNKTVNKVKEKNTKHVEKRVTNLKDRFDKIKNKED